MSISEFSLFDEPPKKENQMNEIKLQTKQKLNFDNISDVFSFSKKNDIPTKSTTPNDNTDINSPILFNSKNIKEVSHFTLNESEPKLLNRKIDFCKEAQIPMELENLDESENSSSLCVSGKKIENTEIINKLKNKLSNLESQIPLIQKEKNNLELWISYF